MEIVQYWISKVCFSQMLWTRCGLFCVNKTIFMTSLKQRFFFLSHCVQCCGSPLLFLLNCMPSTLSPLSPAPSPGHTLGFSRVLPIDSNTPTLPMYCPCTLRSLVHALSPPTLFPDKIPSSLTTWLFLPLGTGLLLCNESSSEVHTEGPFSSPLLSPCCGAQLAGARARGCPEGLRESRTAVLSSPAELSEKSAAC